MVFFSSYDFCLELFNISFVEIVMLFLCWSPHFGEHLCDHYCQLSSLSITSFHFIRSISVDLFCFFLFGIYLPISSFSLALSVGFSVLDKTAASSSLINWSCVGDEPCQSVWLKCLVASQTFIIIQATISILSDSQELKLYQDSSLSQRGGHQ